MLSYGHETICSTIDLYSFAAACSVCRHSFIGYNSKPAVTAPKTVAVTPVAPTRAELLKLVNAERAKHVVAPLKEDARLDASAQFKATDMLQRNYFGHYDPSNKSVMNGVQMGYAVTNHNTCRVISENLSWNTDRSAITDAEAVNWWISSKPHHAAMIDIKYTLTGFGIINDAIVEHFCQQ